MRRLTTEEFIEKAKAVHGDKYDYSKVDYVNAATKVEITCSSHGRFTQRPAAHLRGQACPKCCKPGSSPKTQAAFLRDANAAHKGQYTYEKAVYTHAHNKLVITCPIHGDFEQTASSHTDGRGCPKCAKEAIRCHRRISTEAFIKDSRAVHGSLYMYDKVEYTDSRDFVTITCPVHGDFRQRAGSHKQGVGCPKCHSYTGRTIVYLVHIESHGEEMLKIGITNHEVEQRFSDNLHPDQHVTEIATLEFEDRQDAKTIEAYLHAKHKKHQFTPKVKFAGHTECFNIEALETIKQDFGV